ncbi:hypothetical protein BDV19DRAFT_354145 [Aspergillus venezuelensis]
MLSVNLSKVFLRMFSISLSIFISNPCNCNSPQCIRESSESRETPGERMESQSPEPRRSGESQLLKGSESRPGGPRGARGLVWG